MNYKLRLSRQVVFLSSFLLMMIIYGAIWGLNSRSNSALASSTIRQVNVPYSGDGPEIQPAVFWFGSVDPTTNYADGRAIYSDQALKITVHIFDRLLWYDESPVENELTAWDSVTLFLDLNNIGATTPALSSFKFEAQLNHLQSRANYQAAFQGNGPGWSPSNIPFTTKSGWRGSGLNNYKEARGWRLTFSIPFSSLNLNTAPTKGTKWRMAFAVHDRDDAGGLFIPDQFWPEAADPLSPPTWGILNYGLPEYQRQPALIKNIVTIRHGLNGATVIDGHVGGHSTCGAPYHPDFFSGWGEANYAGYDQINIQNQWDVADWPCFSKYFVKFPLGSVPPGYIVVSATLSMTLFGNAGGDEWGEPPNSYIQVLTVNEDWDEKTVNWNNAPLALENISGAWVKPIQTSDQREYSWDVSKAVMDAYQSGQPVRLALYSADGEQHSGKYFYSSDSNDWGGTVRPALDVTWGETSPLPSPTPQPSPAPSPTPQPSPCGNQGVECNYIPMIGQ